MTGTYTLANKNGMAITVLRYGGIIQKLYVPDKSGQLVDVVLGFDTLDEYMDHNPYFGAIIGRYGNRIAKGEFTLCNVRYQLATNNGPNHLHGGVRGFDKVEWDVRETTVDGDPALDLAYVSRHGEEGYPGMLAVNVKYVLTSKNELRISYFAMSDRPTIANLTNHSYFNLKGHGAGDILNHVLQLSADHYLPTNSTLIPTGRLAEVDGTPFDFRRATPIGKRINDDHEQLRCAGGYDHTFERGVSSRLGYVLEPSNGILMEVITEEPGVQLYTGNFLPKPGEAQLTGKDGAMYAYRGAFCLETQHFPDSPNKPQFPTTIVWPDRPLRSSTIYRFSVQA